MIGFGGRMLGSLIGRLGTEGTKPKRPKRPKRRKRRGKLKNSIKKRIPRKKRKGGRRFGGPKDGRPRKPRNYTTGDRKRGFEIKDKKTGRTIGYGSPAPRFKKRRSGKSPINKKLIRKKRSSKPDMRYRPHGDIFPGARERRLKRGKPTKKKNSRFSIRRRRPIRDLKRRYKL